MKYLRRSILLFLAISLWIGSFTANALELKTEYQDSCPKYYQNDDRSSKFQGICIDIIRALEKEVPDLKIIAQNRFIPFKRIQQNLKNNKIDIFVGFAKNDKRVRQYQFVDIPLYEVNHVVAVRSDDSVAVKSFDDIRNLSDDNVILTNLGTATERYLKKQNGLNVDSLATNLEANFRKMLAKRGRFVYFHDMGLVSIVKRLYPDGEVKVLPTSFKKYNHYLAFSPGTPQSVVKKVEIALQRLADRGVLKKIQAKYSSL